MTDKTNKKHILVPSSLMSSLEILRVQRVLHCQKGHISYQHYGPD